MPFSNNEKRDMLRVFYSSHRNTTIASATYLRMYPERQHPDRTMFLQLDRNLAEYGSFTAPRNYYGNRNLDNQHNILQMVNLKHLL